MEFFIYFGLGTVCGIGIGWLVKPPLRQSELDELRRLQEFARARGIGLRGRDTSPAFTFDEVGEAMSQ